MPICAYKHIDVSEKLFRDDKSYLRNKRLRIYSDEAASGKIFAEFIALIVQYRMHTLAKNKTEYLEKIEMIRNRGGKYHRKYRLDHAVTATQKNILKAYQMEA